MVKVSNGFFVSLNIFTYIILWVNQEMSGKRYDNVSESSSDDEYRRRYKSSCSSNEKFDEYEDDCHDIELKRRATSSSSFETTAKRGRGNSKRPCMNKNAQAARENRIRKKKHLEQVENKLMFYQQKNKSLVNIIQKQDIDIKKLKGEVNYLRCILRNNTNIAALLRSMNEGLSKTSNTEQPKDSKCNAKSTNENYNFKNQQRILQSIPNTKLSKNNKVTHSEFDHTYTIPKTQNVDGLSLNNGRVNRNEKHEDSELCTSSIFEDEILFDFEKEAATHLSLNNSNKFINVNSSDTEMDEWSGLNINIHNNFTNLDGSLSLSDDLEKLTNVYDDSNLLEQFRDAGICLHVNSEKVSLEYCSICHLNSLNSMPE